MDLLSIYNFGVRFLEKHPNLKRLNEKLSGLVVSKCQKKKIFHMKASELSPLTGNDLKSMAVFFFCLAGIFFIFAIITLFHFLFLDSIILLVPVFILYSMGVNNIAEAKLSDDTEEHLSEPISESRIQSVSTSQPSMLEEKKVEQKPLKTPFWRIYDWVERIVIWGWIYISFAYPETIQEYMKKYHVWDYLPHEQNKSDQVDKMGYLFLGIIIFSLAFTVLRGVLKILFSISQKLFSKRDIREL